MDGVMTRLPRLPSLGVCGLALFLSTAALGDYRANLHQGGKARAVRVLQNERRLAIAACRAMGLDVAGVDIIRSERGPLLLEVNSSPGLEGIETALAGGCRVLYTGEDVFFLQQGVKGALERVQSLVRNSRQTTPGD